MKPVFLFVFLALVVKISSGVCQTLTEDAKGQSAIVFGGNSINLDISQTSISANVSNFTNGTPDIQKPNMKVWGLSLFGNNSSGLSTLFSEGKFQPSARIRGFIGIRLIKPKELSDAYVEREIILNAPDIDELADLKEQYFRNADAILSSSSLINNDKIALRKAIKTAIDSRTKPDSPTAVNQRIDRLSGDKTTLTDIKKAIKQVNDQKQVFKAGGLNERLIKANQGLITVREKVNRLRDQYPTDKAMTVYVAGGLNATSFRVYDASKGPTLTDRFTKTPFRGGTVDVGLNYKHGDRWWLGVSAGYERANNFDLLSPTEFIIRTTDVVGNQQLISEKKYTGYSGDFVLYNWGNFRTDALFLSQIGGAESNYRLAWNILYGRFFLSDNASVAPSHLTLGTSLNLFKIAEGNFLGGVYLEAGDVTNAAKAPSTLTGRLSFGLVAKYAFQTILTGN